MIVSLIVAMDRNRVIGAGGEMPWHLPADLKFFKAATMGKPVIMGRKTYESIGKPLAGRRNIVVTRDRAYQAPGCIVVHSPAAALLAAGEAEEVMIIGGAEIYRQFLPQAQRIYLTCIDAAFAGDAVFPEIQPQLWRKQWEKAHGADERHAHPFRWMLLERAEPAAEAGSER